jgi:hypothetical protein
VITFKIGEYAVTVPDDFDVSGWETFSLQHVSDPSDAIQVLQVAAAARLAMSADRVPADRPYFVTRKPSSSVVAARKDQDVAEAPDEASRRPGRLVRLLARIRNRRAL